MCEIPARQILARQIIFKLECAISDSIDEICEKENYEVTYAEINAALLKVLTSNNGYELRSLWKKEDDEGE